MRCSRPIHGVWVALAAVLVLSAPPAHARQPDADLARLRSDYEKGLSTACRVIDDIHRLTLRQLERERAEAGDYETADRVKARLETFERTPATAAILPPPLTQTLTAARAQIRDGANTDGGREYIDFRKSGGKALWNLLGLERGAYEVFLTYSVGLLRFDDPALVQHASKPLEAPGGTLVFGEVTGLGGGASTTLEKKVTTTGAWENFIRESLGRYEFKSTSATVRLEAAEATSGGLMRVRQIELIRIGGGAEPAPASGPVEPAHSLQAIRASHRQAVNSAMEPLLGRFINDSSKLERELATAGDAAGSAAVARWRERLLPVAADGAGDGIPPTPDPTETPQEEKK